MCARVYVLLCYHLAGRVGVCGDEVVRHAEGVHVVPMGMCVCVHVCMCACVHVCMCACVCARVYVCSCVITLQDE